MYIHTCSRVYERVFSSPIRRRIPEFLYSRIPVFLFVKKFQLGLENVGTHSNPVGGPTMVGILTPLHQYMVLQFGRLRAPPPPANIWLKTFAKRWELGPS